MESIAVLLMAFLLGSMPTAYLMGRALKGIDVREAGSGNSGAVNAGRQLGKGVGVLVLLIDAGKGILAILIGRALQVPMLTLYISAVLVVAGHNYSPFLGFRGGKGGATVLGLSALMLWQITGIAIALGAIIFLVTRRAVWAMAGVFMLLNALTIATAQGPGLIILCLLLSLMVAATHFSRRRADLLPALKSGDWRRIMSAD
ncbi:MAG: hypothetical protein BZY79_00215 [SAR202 cluster bacterium Casp-Chloro-G4]|nr:glycerol-3-phosphate acyltransferase [Chloroflexota bacterium]MDA1228382.1 glycerol-3-phosphate acyltransferase [Chloroflexota bacterium]PKB62100.1 MAG: hypothetical protein BZY79_00215 [SAR202 cluster bacterium Casp-Chloro-G4]